MPQQPISLTPSFVKPVSADRSDGRSIAAGAPTGDLARSSNLLDHACKALKLMAASPYQGGKTQRNSDTGGERGGSADDFVSPVGPWMLRHVAVRCHKVTMLQHLVLIPARRLAQEANMAERVPDTPNKQFAGPREKTFTRRQSLKLRSHSSCIDASGVSNFYGAADVSGR